MTRKKLGEETAVQGAVRGSGEFSPVSSNVSGEARLQGQGRSGGNGADGGFRSGECGEVKEKPSAPQFIPLIDNWRTTARFSRRRRIKCGF